MKYKVGLTETSRPSNRFKHRSSSSSGFKPLSSVFSKRVTPMSRTGRMNGTSSLTGKKKLFATLGKIFYIFVGIGFFVLCVGLVLGGIYLKKLESEIPDAGKLIDRKSAYSTQVFDRKGTLLYTFHDGESNREFVSIDKIPEHTKWALLAAEDIEFYQHQGLDLLGIVNSVYINFRSGGIVRGSSTISQQLIKITILSDTLGTQAAYEKSYTRKLKEMLITMQMEQTFEKDQILELYMNEVPLGGVNYGFQAASKSYFGKEVKDLSIAESAMLAGLIQSPSYYSPVFGARPDLAKDRQTYVLDQMLKHKDLTGVTEEEIEAAKNEELVYKSAKIDILAPHFVFYIKQELVKQFGEEIVEQGGLKVTTTLDYSIQKIAEEEVRNGIKKYGHKYNVRNGSMVVLDPHTGDIIAMVGSVDYFETKNKKIDGNVNVTTSERQMGSSVKPYTYLTAFSQGHNPGLLTPDIKNLSFGTYKLDNWDNKFYGLMDARRALNLSRNIPAVYTMQLIGGVDPFIETVEKLGITTLRDRNNYGLSLTLGAGEMKMLEHVAAYSVFANGGIKRDYRGVLKVEDNQGNVLVDNKENKGKRVWDEKEIYLLNWILCDIGGYGDRTYPKDFYYNGKPVYCGKTGTTNGPKDLTAIFYHKNLVVGMWAGNNDNTITPGAWSTSVPQPIVSSFMTRVAGKYKPISFTRPAGVVAGQVCADSGLVPKAGTDCKKISTVFISGRIPKTDSREVIYLCKGTNLIPTNLESAQKYGQVFKAVLLNKELENKAQQGNFDKYMLSFKDVKYISTKPESAECALPLGPDNAPIVDITSPSTGAGYTTGSTINISASARAMENITSVVLSLNGSTIATLTTAPYTYNYVIPESTIPGAYTLSAVATDNFGKTDSDSIVVNISTVDTTVSLTSPTIGKVYTDFPQTLTASTTGSGISSVSFIITGPSGYSRTLVDNDGTNGWSASWTDDSIPNGAFQVKARAVKSGNNYDSSSVSFAVLR